MIYTNENWKPPVTCCEPNKVEVQKMNKEEAIKILRDTPIDIRSTREDDIHTLYATAQGMAIEALQAEPNEVAEQEPKILDTIDFAIDASNGGTNYYVGFRNGLRYAKSLIDGEAPQFENCAEQEPKHGEWIEEKDGWYGGQGCRCSSCGYGYSYKAYHEPYEFDFCPNCGAKMDKE